MSDDTTDNYDYDRTEYATDPEPQGDVTFATPEDDDKPWQNANQLFYQYKILGKKGSEIASLFGCSESTIHRKINQFNIGTRSRSEVNTEYPRLQDSEWLREQYESGLSQEEIAEKIGCTRTGVYHAFDRHGIETRSLSEANTEYPRLQDSEWLREQYESGLSQEEIAEKIGCAPAGVQKSFNRHGIETRTTSEANLLRYELENAVPKSDVPEPPTDPSAEKERTQTGDGTNRTYDGPVTGIDLSWSDTTDEDRGPWVPYRQEEWLRWQYNDLGNSTCEMANLVNVSDFTIRHWMDHFDIPRDGRGTDGNR